MPSPTLTPSTTSRAGVTLTPGTAATVGGDSFANTGGELVTFNNGAGSGTITITEVIQATTDGQAVTSKTVAVAHGAIVIVGPFPTQLYNDTNGWMNFTYTGVASLTVNVILPATN